MKKRKIIFLFTILKCNILLEELKQNQLFFLSMRQSTGRDPQQSGLKKNVGPNLKPLAPPNLGAKVSAIQPCTSLKGKSTLLVAREPVLCRKSGKTRLKWAASYPFIYGVLILLGCGHSYFDS